VLRGTVGALREGTPIKLPAATPTAPVAAAMTAAPASTASTAASAALR